MCAHQVLTQEQGKRWGEMQRMANISGPYGQLPVLHWQDDSDSDEVIISLTITIGDFIDKKLRWPGSLCRSPEHMAKAMSLGS